MISEGEATIEEELTRLRVRLAKAEREAKAGRELFVNICHVIGGGEHYPPRIVEEVLDKYNKAVG